jgi:hypothetical protein
MFWRENKGDIEKKEKKEIEAALVTGINMSVPAWLLP